MNEWTNECIYLSKYSIQLDYGLNYKYSLHISLTIGPTIISVLIALRDYM